MLQLNETAHHTFLTRFHVRGLRKRICLAVATKAAFRQRLTVTDRSPQRRNDGLADWTLRAVRLWAWLRHCPCLNAPVHCCPGPAGHLLSSPTWAVYHEGTVSAACA
jgi:hypothetical protein